MTVRETCLKAKENSGVIATACEKDMNAMLAAAAVALRANAEYIIGENKKDVDSCTRGEQFKDRLMLDEKRIDGIARGLEKLTEIECPVGEILEERTLYNGLKLQRVRVPMGVLGIIYEARPTSRRTRSPSRSRAETQSYCAAARTRIFPTPRSRK